mmetsp:Transcript_26875/g.40675  ORF Transcript_26875/g.40675 Transcript_26875/m.40675 type:complete len:290 (-) Transcript_26875:178-1047(-)|eukprot:CAMPEP_0178912292 /NCGR_PEP_ID=MMETSP0786-20121207/10179_1 /TAXON_ID=186022 /ORGANISM="Thalassionema frauenfeldii, Strain CCMP 1798" /LENGTH=289 /DNA_ID=CAMNT_0020584853 /DNA_START=200 /DNA_END=1069 /DNA_ORIENTATION=-
MEIRSSFSKFLIVLVATLTLSTQNNVSAFTPGMNSRISTVTTSTTSLSMRPTKTTTEKKESFQFKELGMSLVPEADGEERWEDVSKKLELIGLGVWLASISGFILVNNFVGPWPEVMKQIPERVFFLNHMIGGMLFGGGIILTTCIEWLVAKNKDATVLQFWFNKVPLLDTLLVVPALTVSMISGTGLTIRRYGGLNTSPPHVDAIFWTLILFLAWWATTDLTTQGTALKAVNDMYDDSLKAKKGQETEVPKVVTDRHFSNVVSCFFILMLYSVMVLKPGTLFPFPWDA